MKELDRNSFGKYYSSTYLADHLIKLNDKSLINKVGSIINQFNLNIKELKKLDNYFEFYAKYLLKSTQDKINNNNFDKITNNSLLNIISAIYREFLKKDKTKHKFYRLKITLNEKSLSKNKLFDSSKSNSIQWKNLETNEIKTIYFTDSNFFEEIYKTY